MKKILCLVTAAMLVVVMMMPVEVEAADYVEGTDCGPPSVTSSSGSYVVGDEWDSIEVHPGNPDYGTASYYTAYKDYVQYITIDVNKYWASSGYLGYYSFLAPVNLSFYSDVYLYDSQTVTVSVIDVELLGNYSGVAFTQSVMSYNMQVVSSGTYTIDETLGQLRVSAAERVPIGIDGFSQVTLKVVYRLSVGSGSVQAVAPSPDVTLSASVSSWGKVQFYSKSLEATWFDSLKSTVATWGSNIASSVSTLQTNIGTWFNTQWDKMQSWTDSIVDAITGSGGGENISEAQEKLDATLDEVSGLEDMIEEGIYDSGFALPTLQLNDNQSSALVWVIGMMNTWYVAFDELQVLFAAVFFFGVFGVVFFGRRNL